MNNKIRKEMKDMIANEITLYNFHVKNYHRYKDIDPLRCKASVEQCRLYLHSINKLIDSVNICDSSNNYFLVFESVHFYSLCSLLVEKVEG